MSHYGGRAASLPSFRLKNGCAQDDAHFGDCRRAVADIMNNQMRGIFTRDIFPRSLILRWAATLLLVVRVRVRSGAGFAAIVSFVAARSRNRASAAKLWRAERRRFRGGQWRYPENPGGHQRGERGVHGDRQARQARDGSEAGGLSHSG